MNDAFLHRRRRVSRNDQAKVLNVAMSLAGRRSDVLRPFPPWLVGGAANSPAADADDFKPTLVKGANFVGFLKPFETEQYTARGFRQVTLCCKGIPGMIRRKNTDTPQSVLLLSARPLLPFRSTPLSSLGRSATRSSDARPRGTLRI